MDEAGSFGCFEDLLAVIPEKGLSPCPVCPEGRYRPTWKSRLVRHLKVHWKNGVSCGGEH